MLETLCQPIEMDASIFRTYDIRGIVNETLTEQTIYWLGKALGSLVQENGETQIVIGRDGRLSSPLLSQCLAQGILDTGCHVIDIGMVPTPVLYFATHLFDQHSGVMLTGSHNPANYNGLKMVINGKTLAEEGIQQLLYRIKSQQFKSGAGRLHQYDITEHYLQEIKETIHLARPLKVVVDAGNGVTGQLAPQLFRLLGCAVYELFCEIDGRFPHHHPDPTQPENLKALIQSVKTYQADLGLAFDGDGDRLGMVTASGEIIYADRMLMLYAQHVLNEHPQAKIIFDVKCTNHLADVIKQFGGEPLMWKTGHSLIKTKMAETQALLAGEMSGHFFFKDRWYGFDDALYAGARMLEILSYQAKTSDAVFAAIPNSISTPELKVVVSENEKYELMNQLIAKADFKQAKEINTIDGLRVSFAGGWGLVRPSNTTPCLVLRFEAINEIMLHEIKTRFSQWMLSVKPDLILPF